MQQQLRLNASPYETVLFRVTAHRSERPQHCDTCFPPSLVEELRSWYGGVPFVGSSVDRLTGDLYVFFDDRHSPRTPTQMQVKDTVELKDTAMRGYFGNGRWERMKVEGKRYFRGEVVRDGSGRPLFVTLRQAERDRGSVIKDAGF